MASLTDPQYGGSRLLTSVADYAGLPLDQVNFVASQVAALLLAPLLRTHLHPSRASPENRQAVCLAIGLSMAWFCFGQTVLVVSMLYLSLVHLYNQFINQNTISVDITAPLMVVTQKVTSLAFSLHDGSTDPQKLKPMQAYHAVKNLPSPLEFFSFALQFQTMLAGPLVLYNDYKDFVAGTTLAKCRAGAPPSPTRAVLKKVFGSFACLFVFLWLVPTFPITRVKEPEFLSGKGLPGQIIYLVVATSVVRLKYYHVWILADAIANSSGLGLKAPSTPGQQPTWDLISNVDVMGFEMGLTLRDSVNEWNKGTSTWLRLLVYERATRMRTLQTYVLSALWHGFHPGYYLTFISGALFTVAARSARRCLRHHFLGSARYKHMYDCSTFLATRILMGYVTFPFVLLELRPCIRIYSHMYWWYHLAAAAAIILLPRMVPPPPRNSEATMARSKREVGGKLAATLEDHEGNVELVAPPNMSPSVRRRHLLRDVVLADSGKILKLHSTALVTE
ncbi:hypothetical protein B566_EDAN009489 [Ephemera danica]|nr:hypothetical protein B566_EDAN009489 [Ephemera danica]